MEEGKWGKILEEGERKEEGGGERRGEERRGEGRERELHPALRHASFLEFPVPSLRTSSSILNSPFLPPIWVPLLQGGNSLFFRLSSLAP